MSHNQQSEQPESLRNTEPTIAMGVAFFAGVFVGVLLGITLVIAVLVVPFSA